MRKLRHYKVRHRVRGLTVRADVQVSSRSLSSLVFFLLRYGGVWPLGPPPEWSLLIPLQLDLFPPPLIPIPPCGSAGKESACNARDLGSIAGIRRSPGEENGYPLQYSGLENSMDHIVHGVAKSQTRLCNFRGFPHSSDGKESACNAGDPGLIPDSGRSTGEGIGYPLQFLGFPCGSAGKESACNSGDLGSIPGLEGSPGEGKGYPLPYSGLENSMDCIVHGSAKSWTWMSDFHFHQCISRNFRKKIILCGHLLILY